MKIDSDQRRKPTHHDLGQKRQVKRKAWRHPLNRSIKVPHRAAAAIAVMEMGISDYDVIAKAVDLTVQEVEKIDLAEDDAIRQLGVEGIPHGVHFKLYKKVRCPKCDAWVTIAPCVACDTRQRPDAPTVSE